MKYLLDTCVVSELHKSPCDDHVRAFVSRLPSQHVFLSVITLGEIRYGINLLPHSKKRQNYEWFLQQLETQYSQQLLPINADVAKIWGELTAKARSEGKQVEMADGLIAATAKCYGLHVVTRNIKDFTPTAAMLINPWED
jgi:predicted nucleic acid-binding protein